MFKMLPQSCQGCPLYSNPLCGRFTKVEGNGRLGVLLVGEASGEGEGASGLPFRPEEQAGGQLEKAIRRAGFFREDFWVTNILRCRPPNNLLLGMSYEREAIDNCSPNLDEVVREYKPRAIVALGGVPARELTGLGGEKLWISYIRGYTLPSRYGIPVIPTFHPSFIARGNHRLLGLLMRDITQGVLVAQGMAPGPTMDGRRMVKEYGSLESLQTLWEMAREDPKMPIYYDIETDESKEEDEDALYEFQKEEEKKLNEFSSEGDDGDTEDSSEGDGDEVGEVDDPATHRVTALGSLDISKAEIKTVQFAIKGTEGVSIPFGSGSRDLIQRILALPNPKIAHNGEYFDKPILERHGFHIKGEQWDTLMMWRHWQPDLPGNLQQVAISAKPDMFLWKHLAAGALGFYGVVDVAILHYIYPYLRRLLEENGLWWGFWYLTNKFRQDVIRPMELRGVPVDVERQRNLSVELTEEVGKMKGELLECIPPQLHKMEAYDNMPPMIKDYVLTLYPRWFQSGWKWLKDGRIQIIKSKATLKGLYQKMWSPEADEELKVIRMGVLEKWPQLRFDGKGLSWWEPFNPNSSKQMMAYLTLKGYPIPLSTKTKKPTTASKEMMRLYAQVKDPVIKLSHEIRISGKMIDSYAGKVNPVTDELEGGWKADEDGRVRAIFTFKSTGQLAASPNLLTMPVRREELAEKFRRVVRALPGHTLLEIDYRAFHARTSGLAARDADYMRLADLDVHSYVTAHMLSPKATQETIAKALAKREVALRDGDIKTSLDMEKQLNAIEEVQPYLRGLGGWLELDDEALVVRLELIKAGYKFIRNLQAKPAILGTAYGQGYNRLYMENIEYFDSPLAAKRLLDLLKRVFPKLFKWQDDVVGLADDQGFLDNAWGWRRWFWGAKKWAKRQGKWVKVPDKDAEKVKAYLPSSNAHGMLRKKLMEMNELGLLERYQLILIVHDAVLFHCPTHLVEEAIPVLQGIMEAPVMELRDEVVAPNGFTCRAEATVGDDWAKGSMVSLEKWRG